MSHIALSILAIICLISITTVYGSLCETEGGWKTECPGPLNSKDEKYCCKSLLQSYGCCNQEKLETLWSDRAIETIVIVAQFFIVIFIPITCLLLCCCSCTCCPFYPPRSDGAVYSYATQLPAPVQAIVQNSLDVGNTHLV